MEPSVLFRARLRAILLAIALGASGALPRAASAADAAPPAPPSAPEILQELKSFSQMASVLMVAAHPDDENTQLITYLARGRNYRMAYLSVTRGNGGQNLLGPEFGDELGLIRTNELLAARNLDLGRQYFTRAIDFGYSKSPVETLATWDRDQVLGDVVRVIRTFRPDVVVTRFSTQTQQGQHGHHTASAILGVEAFKIAGDPKAYPEQIAQGLAPWQPTRILLNAGNQGATGNDPVLNESFASISQRSRAMHKSQGFGGAPGGAGPGRGPGGPGGAAAAPGGAALGTLSPQGFQLLGGTPITTDIMDGIDTTWARVDAASDVGPRYGSKITKLTADAIDKFDVKNPEASVPALLEIRTLVYSIPTTLRADPIHSEKRALIDRLIAECLGLTVQSTVASAEVTPGETLHIHNTVLLRGSTPVRWLGVEYANGTVPREPVPEPLKSGTVASRDLDETLAASTPVSQPYWLREPADPGIYHVADPLLIGMPMNPPVFPAVFQFEVAGQAIRLSDELVQVIPDAPAPQRRRPLTVIAPVWFKVPYDVELFWQKPNTHQYNVEVTASRANLTGTVTLEVPAGWKVEPASLPLSLAAAGATAKLGFHITAPEGAASGSITATATVGGVKYAVERKKIAYDHLPVLLIQPAATAKAVSLDVKTLARTVGYLPGAGDSVADAIAQLGITVKILTTKDLTPETLQSLDAVVIGVRAFNTRNDLAADSSGLKAIFAYAANGGTVIEQYNRPDGPGGTNLARIATLAPFPIHISALRVTDENAPVKFLVPDSPALNTPNKITDADFANWVQERNIYLPDQFAPEFKPILGMADPGENPPNSSLLIAQTGKGYFVYTSLVFFRELPAGNPGAYRLFANLLSLGKS